jgi:protein-L-isoaspartate(D-aspartate) O-methyltransferase
MISHNEQVQPDPHRRQREMMVEQQIKARGVKEPRVLEAMKTVPRERFVPNERRSEAFVDGAMAIGAGQTISQPYMVGSMTALLQVEPEDTVLEIGTGSGYQTAVLAHLARHVFTMERLGELQMPAKTLLSELGVDNVSYHVGDGTLGWPEKAPFERIIVTAGAPKLPEPLVDQLADGGRMVIPIGGSSEQTLTIVERHGEKIRELPQYMCRFVKLIGAAGWPKEAS